MKATTEMERDKRPCHLLTRKGCDKLIERMNHMNLHKVKEVRRTSDLEEVNELLTTDRWKIAHEMITEYGELEFILYRM